MNKAKVSFTLGKRIASLSDLKLPVVYVPQEVIEETQKLLLSFSGQKQMRKGIVYWVGTETEQGLFVTQAIAPRAAATPISFRVEAVENARIVAELQKQGLQLIAQVHSHPNGVEVDHFITEPEMGFLPFEGFFSLVVRDYATNGLLPLTEKTGIFYYWKGRFLRLTDQQIEAYLQVIPAGGIL